MRTAVLLLWLPVVALALGEGKRPPSLRHLNPPGLAQPTGYTHVVEVKGGRFLYIAGQVPLDAEGRTVGAGDFRAQAHKAFENLRTALAAAGASFEHVVKTNIYLADMSHVATFREVRGNYIREPAPASTLVEARLVRPEWLIEIEAVAVLPD